jgi:hypothetical protein
MKIYTYKVVPDHDDTKPFEQTLEECARKSLPERLHDQGGVKLRLEELQRRNGLLELNFVSLREGSAPVRVAEDRPAAEITIGDDEYFGEETACLYDPGRRYLVTQYNHYGPRVGSIRESLRYGEDGVRHGYEFVPKLHPTSEARIRSLALVSRVEVSFAIPDLANAGDDLSVAESIDLARAQGAQRLEIVLGSRTGLRIGPITDWLLRLRRLGGHEDAAIQKLTVRACEEADGPRETIDLLADRLCRDLPLPPTRRRVPLETRMRALRQAHQDWCDANQLT